MLWHNQNEQRYTLHNDSVVTVARVIGEAILLKDNL